MKSAAACPVADAPDTAPSLGAMAWYVYLIECQDGSIYTGISNDVAARFAAHQRGKGARYTRSHPPKSLLLSITCADRAMASRLEYRIKRLSAAQKRQLNAEAAARLIFAGDPAKKP